MHAHACQTAALGSSVADFCLPLMTRLACGTEEAREGRDAFLEKRSPEYDEFPWHY